MPANRDADTSLTLLERLQKNPDDPGWRLDAVYRAVPATWIR